MLFFLGQHFFNHNGRIHRLVDMDSDARNERRQPAARAAPMLRILKSEVFSKCTTFLRETKNIASSPHVVLVTLVSMAFCQFATHRVSRYRQRKSFVNPVNQ